MQAAAAAAAARFRHPAASRWAGYRAPPLWAGRAAWGNQGRGSLSRRSRRPASNGRCKNRSLIRVRSLIMPQPTAAGAAAAAAAAAKRAASLSGAAAAAAAAAVARRASFGLTRSALALRVKAGAAAPTSFVRSGKHGMAIRRVNSSELAARRAAAAAPGAIKPPTLAAASAAIASAKGGKMRAGKWSPGPAAREKAVVVSKGSASAAPAVAATAAAASKSAVLLARKAALLSKARARSGASRKAAAVVAGARVKRARVLMRNMTLYRGRGEAGVVAGGGSGTGGGGGAQAAEKDKEKKQKEMNTSKKARVKAEPCLFFCKFGKCSKSDEDCRFAHDKAKVAVCRAFLRGNCEKKEKCLLTHAVQAEKMPVCIYFEKGLCFTPNCPYLHVKVSRNAAVCPMFLKVCTFFCLL